MTPAVARTLTILLVEDNPGDIRLIAEMLRDEIDGFEIESVGALAPALERLSSVGVDAVLLDLGLPDSEGHETFSRVQKAAPRHPIIVISGLDDRALARDAVREGAQDYLVKGQIDGQLLARVIRHAVERKQGEEEIRESERRFRELAEAVREVFFVVDPLTGVVIYMNPAYETVFGQSLDYVYATPFAWLESVHPEDREEVAALESASSQDGKTRSLEFRIVRSDNTTRWIRAEATPILDANGQVVRLVGIAEDITDLKETEEQFRHSQKMEAVGRLAGGVAHDFNNILTTVLVHSALLLDDLEVDSPHREGVTEIRVAAQRAAALRRQLLSFSRQQVLQFTVVNVNDVVQNLEKMLIRLIGADVTLRVAYGADIGNVRADVGQLEQVITNLVVNARDAMPRGGWLTIDTANVELTEPYVEAHQVAEVGSYIVVAVTDTGTGMSAETRARIFEPFFTTKDKGKGTGLGMSTSYGIVQQSGGYIWVYSELGRGTTFKIYLPRIYEDADTPGPVRGTSGTPTGTETILLAEDDDQIRVLVADLLRRFGYTVIAAASTLEALERSRAHSGPIHLLLTDVIMPGETGWQLANRLAGDHPGLRTLFMSGYTDQAIADQNILVGEVDYLQKPFTPAQLAQRVRQALDANA
jgi:PAS domain S-box-containing protein